MAAVFTLWGGPEDGLAVDVVSGLTEYVLNSPSTNTVGVANRAPTVPMQKACYRWNSDTKRFEWKGYL